MLGLVNLHLLFAVLVELPELLGSQLFDGDGDLLILHVVILILGLHPTIRSVILQFLVLLQHEVVFHTVCIFIRHRRVFDLKFAVSVPPEVVGVFMCMEQLEMELAL